MFYGKIRTYEILRNIISAALINLMEEIGTEIFLINTELQQGYKIR